MKPLLATGSVVLNFLNSKVGAWPAQPIDSSKPWQWQDRRPIKPQPFKDHSLWPNDSSHVEWSDVKLMPGYYSPHKVGDIIYVRESFRATGLFYGMKPSMTEACAEFIYKADASITDKSLYCFAPSMHMPKWASRIHLEVMRVRVEEDQMKPAWMRIHSACPECGQVFTESESPQFSDPEGKTFI